MTITLDTKPSIRPASACLAVLLALLTFTSFSHAQDRGDGPLNPAQPTGISVDDIIQKFAAREKDFAQARENYTFRQDVTMNTMDGNTPNGEYKQVVDVTFDDKGRRRENVVFAPQPSLQGISMDPEDYEDINHRYPFVLTTDEIPVYQILYIGQQRLDEIDTYVFDIAPKNLEKGKRYFQGRIWVDNQDFQIVKSSGKPAFMKEKRLEGHLFPSFTTYREQIDGKYWFPTYTHSDEVLHFEPTRNSPGSDIHLRIKVKYTDYKKFASKSKIIFGGEEIKNEPNQQPPNPPKK